MQHRPAVFAALLGLTRAGSKDWRFLGPGRLEPHRVTRVQSARAFTMSSTTRWRGSDRKGQVSHAGAENTTTRVTGRIFSASSAYFSHEFTNGQP